MGNIYHWYLSGGIIKIKIHEYGDFVSFTHREPYKALYKAISQHFIVVNDLHSFLLTMLSFCWFYLELVLPFSLRQFLLRFLIIISDNF